MDDQDPPPRRPSISQLSKTPSWVMLGFIFGAAFVLALPRRQPPARQIVVAPSVERAQPSEPPQLTTIETLFDQWSQFAVWSDDITQIAVWNTGMGDFTDFYEVRRIDGANYFRSIPRLTSRIVRHGKPPPTECPIRFTETDEQYQEWRSENRFERPPENVRPSMTPPRYTPEMPKPSATVTPIKPPPVNQEGEKDPLR